MTRRIPLLLAIVLAVLAPLLIAAPASAHEVAMQAPILAVTEPNAPTDPSDPDGPTIGIDINGVNGSPSTPVAIIVAITVLSVAPALLLMTTAFTKVFVVLSITRNATGMQAVPPNQVIAGLALFVSLFIMTPTLTEVVNDGVRPYLNGDKGMTQAFEDGVEPMRDFMLKHTRDEDLALMTKTAGLDLPQSRQDVALTTLIPSFILSELRAGFIIGFVVFIPFLIIDIVVSSVLMSMGMMMLPPMMISLPFKLLLFVMVDGWGLIITALVGSYA